MRPELSTPSHVYELFGCTTHSRAWVQLWSRTGA